MNKKILNSAFLMLTITLAFEACKKSDDGSNASNKDKIIGKWMQTYDASDNNQNGILDASERMVLKAGDYNYVTYYNSGTFLDSAMYQSNFQKIPGVYTFSTDEKYVTMSFLGYPVKYQINQLDGDNLILGDTSTNPDTWIIYVKK